MTLRQITKLTFLILCMNVFLNVQASEFTQHKAGPSAPISMSKQDLLAKQITSDMDYLPEAQYDPSIPNPESVLGYPVGTWHVRHDQLVAYMRLLAEKSERISIETTGYTHEQRPLVVLTITGSKNRARLEDIRTRHIAGFMDGESAPKQSPLILYMGYSVHGNEPSGSNAALLLAYYLAAAQDQRVERLLEETVILLDPSMNPDGLSRFAQWANMHKSYHLVSDPAHREHQEGWPSGRTNHYWFDLNRDWLLLTHPESRARVAKFQQWRPHILTDFHEMGTNSTYFFQPGVASRKNPWTPDTNVTLTQALAQFHANALDGDHQLYFAEERFDDFYYGKGSSYPDAQGSIGILFEQASSRGHLQDSVNGVLSFPRTIQNQVTTSLSTFDGALDNKQAFLAYQKQFVEQTQQLIEKDNIHGYVIKLGKDHSKAKRLLSILQAHTIEVFALDKTLELDNHRFDAKDSIFIPTDQPQYRLLKSLFSERKSFVDNTFYDVSNWNIAFAFGLDYVALENSDRRKLKSTSIDNLKMPLVSDIEAQDAVAFVYEWHDSDAPKLTQFLLKSGVDLRVAGSAFTATTRKGQQAFAAGSVIIPAAFNDLAALQAYWQQHPDAKFAQAIHTISSGFTSVGIDLGSPSFAKMRLPKVLLVGGEGTSQYEVGEIWHYLDVRVGMPVSLVEKQRLASVNINDYSHIIFASGRYSDLSKSFNEKLSSWVKAGGVLIGQKSALRWFDDNDWINNEVLKSSAIDAAFSTEDMQYKDKSALSAKKLVAGSAFEVNVDLSHPLFFGYESPAMAFFKTNNMVLQQSDDPFSDIAKYSDSPLLGGFAADEMQELIANSTALVVNQSGRGVVIGFVDNIHFRGYWDGTNKLMSNAIFMSELMN